MCLASLVFDGAKKARQDFLGGSNYSKNKHSTLISAKMITIPKLLKNLFFG